MTGLFSSPAEWAFPLLAAVILASASYAASGPADARRAPIDICAHPWFYSTPPFRIAANLYYVGNKNVSSHLIDTGKGLILLDTAFPQTAGG